MNIIRKIRQQFVEYIKHIFDPIVNVYLRRRYGIKKAYQGMFTSSNMYEVYQSPLFNGCYERSILNDSTLARQKDSLRFRYYINASIARLAISGGGDFVCVGVSYGVAPRLIYEYLKPTGFWNGSHKFFLVDKFDQAWCPSMGTKIQQSYCGSFRFIKEEFQEKNFEIIKQHAPQAFVEYRINNKISFLLLDANDMVSEYKTIELLYDQITCPGFIIIDNYGAYASNEAINSFLKTNNNFVIPIGNHQGIVIKLWE